MRFFRIPDLRSYAPATLAAVCLALVTPAAAQAPGLELPGAGRTPAEDAQPAAAPLELESPDPEIAARLSDLFREIEGLESVRAQVRGGVVTLGGSTLTPGHRRQAEQIASRLAGVVSVENEIVTEHRVTRRLEPLVDQAREGLRSAISFAPLALVAILVFLAFWLAGSFVTRSTRLFGRLAPNAFIESLIGQVIRLAFIVAGLVAAMSILGATTILASVLGAAGLFGLAVGFAVRDTIENYIASVLLSVRQPFAPNDHVLIEGHEGRITLLNSRATLLTTLDGNEVRIPNATVYKAIIINFTRLPERRFEFEVGVGYENDLLQAQALARRALRGVPGVLQEPRPLALAERLDPYAVTLKIYGWVDQAVSDYFKVRSEAIRTVKTVLEQAGVSMPEPIQNVRQLPPASAPPAAARKTAALSKTPEDVDAVTDTTADRTIEEKVQAIRATDSEDFLSPNAPRE
ncbi:MAG: mechanosensitive ion channel domain-containing protein [Pseudomonadota bacterium]